MKKIIIAIIVFVVVLAFTLPIYATPVVSDNASEKAAFGQARAAGASGLNPNIEHPIGLNYFSVRKGDNAAMNHAWMEKYNVGPYK